jgi:transposase
MEGWGRLWRWRVRPPTREVLEAYLEWMLEPALEQSQGVVLDNVSAHKGPRVRQLIGERGCELLYLPPYSPDAMTIVPHPRGFLEGQVPSTKS